MKYYITTNNNGISTKLLLHLEIRKVIFSGNQISISIEHTMQIIKNRNVSIKKYFRCNISSSKGRRDTQPFQIPQICGQMKRKAKKCALHTKSSRLCLALCAQAVGAFSASVRLALFKTKLDCLLILLWSLCRIPLSSPVSMSVCSILVLIVQLEC